ncbi:MAG: glutaredoxin family protein [Mariprofundaceae bacterium]|nr:glutaredoxin family protein [Mariprofundaceae bacterium]
MTSPVLQLMSRQGCCLCEDAEVVIADFVAQGCCILDVVDVDQDPALAARFGMDVPVVLKDDEVRLMHRITHGDLEALLEVAC